MNGEQALFKILPDKNGKVTQWICDGLNETTDWLGDYFTLGFWINDEIVGGLIFHDYRLHTDVWWTIYAPDKRWCTRRVLRRMFSLAFDVLRCRRINLLVSTDNNACLRFVRKLGFQTEGLLRQFREDGRDCYFMGLLKQERKF